MDSQDQEVTLGTGRLLGLFFGLVIICALFFSLGFSLGRKPAAEPVLAAATSAIPTSGAAKPSPTVPETAVKPDCAIAGACPPDNAAKSTSDELTFYKAVEQNEPKAKLESPPKPPSPQVTARTIESKPAWPGMGYMVQVAAVTKQDDADALVNALRKKNYPVLTTNGPADKFYHVQVGPFPDVREAESMRSKLIGDGYNPILKK
ncbi:MAG: SPOR domain-containing protein [Acidobacteriia bacterium]|nr:SPOR domain-containing protein [Terriglobia bacterium]